VSTGREEDRPAYLAADLLLRAGRLLSRALPGRIKRGIEDRFFYAVFNVTRVTNDNYGWRPPEGSGGPP